MAFKADEQGKGLGDLDTVYKLRDGLLSQRLAKHSLFKWALPPNPDREEKAWYKIDAPLAISTRPVYLNSGIAAFVYQR